MAAAGGAPATEPPTPPPPRPAQVRKRKDHFIFTIESSGALRPELLFKRALAILAGKADQLAARLA